MSYTVDVEVTDRGEAGQCLGMKVTTFAGGERGRMVQITLQSAGFVQLDMQQLKKLRKLLKHAQRESFANLSNAS